MVRAKDRDLKRKMIKTVVINRGDRQGIPESGGGNNCERSQWRGGKLEMEERKIEEIEFTGS